MYIDSLPFHCTQRSLKEIPPVYCFVDLRICNVNVKKKSSLMNEELNCVIETTWSNQIKWYKQMWSCTFYFTLPMSSLFLPTCLPQLILTKEQADFPAPTVFLQPKNIQIGIFISKLLISPYKRSLTWL